MLNNSHQLHVLKRAYNVLEVTESANIDQVKQAYRRAARKYHPDLQTVHSGPNIFQRVVKAYNYILSVRQNPQILSDIDSNGNRVEGSTNGSSWFSFGNIMKASRDKFQGIWDRHPESCSNGAGTTYRSPSNGTSQSHRYTESNGATGGKQSLFSLTSTLDYADDPFEQIRALRAIYNGYPESFERVGVTRLFRIHDRAKPELIRMLGRIKSRTSLEALAPMPTNKNIRVAFAAFTALERTGANGQTIIDRTLAEPMASSKANVSGLGQLELEKRILGAQCVTLSQFRRLKAFTSLTGAPFQDVLKGVDITIPSSA